MTSRTAECQTSLSFIISHEIFSNSCTFSQWCYLTISSSAACFSPCPQSLPASGSFPMSQFSIRWPKYWNFSFSISPSNEYLGLIFFRIDWFDLLEVQGSLKKSPAWQFKRINYLALDLLYSPTLTFTNDYKENHSLTTWTFVGKVMPLLLNTLSRFTIAFFPRRKNLLISWLQDNNLQNY